MNPCALSCCLLFVLCLAPALSAQCGNEESLLADIEVTGPSYGWDVAVAGDLALVGATQYSTFHLGSGRVTVFEHDGFNWLASPSFGPPPSSCSDEFGHSLDTDGNWLIVSAPRALCGSPLAQVSFFKEVGGVWTAVQSFGVSSGYGKGVALDGDWAAVSQPTFEVELYHNLGGIWKAVDAVFNAGSSINDGGAVALSGNVLVVGAELVNSNTGNVSVYRFDGVAWEFEQTLTASDAAPGNSFGYTVAVDGDVIVVGAPFRSDPNPQAGAVYVFRHNGSSWQDDGKLNAPTPSSNAYFGWDVDIAQGVLVVGEPANLTAGTGSAHVFRHDGVAWQHRQQLLASDGEPFDQLGWSVATDGVTAVIGAIQGSQFGLSKNGKAYTFPVTPITLLLDNKRPSGGDTITFSTCLGQPGTPSYLLITSYNGVPIVVPLIQATFDAAGSSSTSIVVPAALMSITAGFTAGGLSTSGSLSLSNVQKLQIP